MIMCSEEIVSYDRITKYVVDKRLTLKDIYIIKRKKEGVHCDHHPGTRAI